MSTENEFRPKFIQCDRSRYNQLKTFCWCEAEHPYLIVSCEFTVPGSNTFHSGFLMITFGAHYLFKNKVFGGIEFVMEFNILQISLLRITETELIFDFSDGAGDDSQLSTHLSTNGISPKKKYSKSALKSAIVIKSDKIEQIASTTLYVLKTVAYALVGVQLMRIESSINFEQIDFEQRPENALRHRVIFLAHYYEEHGPNLDEVVDITKWENLHSGVFFIGSKFDPGNYAIAFAHSLAWDAEIKTIVFKDFIAHCFPEFFDCLLTNAHIDTTSELIFQEYHSVIDFSGHAISNPNCGVKTFRFCRVPGQLVLNFVTKCTHIPFIENLALQSIKFEENEMINICKAASENETLINTIQQFELSRCGLNNCTSKHITSMLSHFRCLNTIIIRDFVGDGVRFLNTISKANIPVRLCRFNFLKFKGSFDKVNYPDTLRYLDVSFCEFTDVAISSFLVSLTKSPMKEPIILEMRKLHLKKNSYPAIANVNFNQCCPNIAEFDFSYNRIPAFGVRSLFAFLFTQKNLRLLSLDHVATTAPVAFLKNVMVLILSLQLPGFDISSATKEDLQYLQYKQAKKGKRTSTGSGDSSSVTSQPATDEDDNTPNSFTFIDSNNDHNANFTQLVDSLMPNESAQAPDPTPTESKSDDQSNSPDSLKMIYSSRLQQSIQAFVQQNYTVFRRLSLSHARFEQEGIDALIRLIEMSPNLNEIDIGKLKYRTPENFFRFWKVVASKPSIVACNYPEEDMNELHINILEQSAENQDIMQKIRDKSRPSTPKKRVACLMSKPVRKANPQQLVARDDDLFRRCASFDYTETEHIDISKFLAKQMKKVKKVKSKKGAGQQPPLPPKPEGDYVIGIDDDNDDINDNEFQFEDDEIEQTPNNNEIQAYDMKNDTSAKGYNFGVQFIDNLID